MDITRCKLCRILILTRRSFLTRMGILNPEKSFNFGPPSALLNNEWSVTNVRMTREGSQRPFKYRSYTSHTASKDQAITVVPGPNGQLFMYFIDKVTEQWQSVRLVPEEAMAIVDLLKERPGVVVQDGMKNDLDLDSRKRIGFDD